MKCSPFVVLFVACLGMTSGLSPAAYSADGGAVVTPGAQMGVIVGHVSNAATGANLEGASVRLDGTSYSVLSARDGTFRISAPPGNYTLNVSYTGLDAQSAPIALAAGQSVSHDFGLTSNIYRMSQFVVSSEREGNALAITLQRHSDGVKNIVSADAFGNLAGNPADLLMRMPGVSGESVGGDTRYIRIRGLHYNLASVSIDGNRMADAASGGSTREVQWQQAGTETVERVEVTKSPTADMPADSIGGAVNVISKSAFDRARGRQIGGSLGAVWRPTDERSRPMRQWTVSYSEVFQDKFGVSFNYGFQPTESLIDGSMQVHQNLPNTTPGPAYTNSFYFRDSLNKRTRWGGGLKLDYKYSENTRFFANVLMNKHDEHANIREVTWSTAATVATRDAAGNLTGTGAIIPGYTDQITEWRPVVQSLAQPDANTTHKQGKAWNYQLGGVQRYEGLDINYDVYHSTSYSNYPGNKTFTLTATGIGMRIDHKDHPQVPDIVQTAGPDMTKISSYSSNTYEIASMSGDDRYWGSSVDVKKKIDTVIPAFIKAGLRWREQTRKLTNTPWTGSYLGSNYAELLNPDTRNTVFGGKYPLMPFPAFPGRDMPGSARNQPAGYNIDMIFRSHPELFARNTAANLQTELTGRTNFKEEVSAGYAMGNFELGPLTVVGGLRVEKTEVTGTGAANVVTPEEAARRAAYVGAVTEAESVRRTLAQYGNRITRGGDYQGLFPSLHFKYDLARGFVSRLSYASNIGRPNIGQLVPNTTVNLDTKTLTTSNPALKPQYADNFDLSLEYYYEPSGLVSVGVFYKEMKDFIFTQGGAIVPSGVDNGFGGQYEGFSLTTQYNGGTAKVKGIELSYTQQFTFLPGWMQGLGAFANYTRLKAEGDYSIGNAITLGMVNANTNEVANFVPISANAGISYIRNKMSLRFQFNYIGRFLNTYNANISRMLYRVARPTLDIKFNYQLSKNFDFYIDAWNVLAQGDRVLEYSGGRPQRLDKMHVQYFFGVKARL